MTEEEFRGPRPAANLVQIDAKELQRLQSVAGLAAKLLQALDKGDVHDVVLRSERLHVELYVRPMLDADLQHPVMPDADERSAEGQAQAAGG